MNPAARFHDVTAVGIGAFIGSAGASDNGGMLFIGICVAVVFTVARTIEDHYLKQIEQRRP